MASRSLGTLTLDLVAKIGGFTEGLDKAGRESQKRMKAIKADAEQLGKDIAIALTASAGAFATLVQLAVNTADEMSKVAQATGLTTEALSQLQYAADLSGVEDLGNSLVKFNRNISEAAVGTAAQAEAFAALGVSIKNADGSLRNTEDILNDTAEAFSQFEDGANKTAVAMELFGKSGAQLIPFLNEGAAGLGELRAEADAFGLTLTESTGKAAEAFNDNLSRLQSIIKGVALQTAAELLPAMEGVSNVFVDTLKDTEAVDKAMEGLAATFKVVVSAGIVTKNAFEVLGKTLGGLAAYFVALFTDGIEAASEVSRSFSEDVSADFTDVFENIDKVWSKTVAAVPEAAAAAGEETRKTLELVGKDAEEAAKKAAKAASAAQKEAAKAAKEAADLARESALEQERIRERNLQAIRETIASLEAEVGALFATADAQDARTVAILKEQGATEELIKDAEKLLAVRRSLNQIKDFGISVDSLSFDYAVNLDPVFDSLDDLEGAFERLGGTAGDAFRAISDSAKLFAVAAKLEGEEAFAAYAEGAASALKAVQSFAKEGSSEYRTLGLAIQALHTITAVQAALNALATAPVPANFAAYASVLAAVASLGIAIGGGGGSSGGELDSSGSYSSGTVLGKPDAASESIANGIELLISIEDQGLDVARGMLTALQNIERLQKDLSANFAQLAGEVGTQSLVLSGTIGNLSTAGSSTALPINPTLPPGFMGNSGIGGSSADRYIRYLEEQAANEALSGDFAALGEQVQRIFAEIGNALYEGVSILGGDAEAALELFNALDIGELVIKEGESIDEAVARLINSVGDRAIDIASALAGFDLAPFQNFGEGALETLTRVGAQFNILKDVSGAFGISLNGTTEEVAYAADAIADFAGGVEEFARNMAEFLDFALTDAEQFERQGDQLAEIFRSLGMELPATRDGVRDLFDSLDPLTEAGQRAIAAITAASPLLAEFFGQIEDFAADAYDIRARLGLNDGLNPLREALEGVGLSLSDLQTIASRFGPNEADKATGFISRLLGRLSDQDLASLGPFIDDILGLVNGVTQAGQNAGLAAAESDLMRAYEMESAALKTAAEAFQSIVDDLTDFQDELRFGPLARLTPQNQYAAERDRFREVSALARSGDQDALAQLPEVARAFLEASQANFATSTKYFADLAMVNDVVGDSIGSATNEVDIYQRQLDKMTEQVSQFIELNSNVLSVKQAIDKLIELQGGKDANQVQAQMGEDLSALSTSSVATNKILASRISRIARAVEDIATDNRLVRSSR